MPTPGRQAPAEPRRRMRADAQRNYQRLVAIAREVFTEQGPADASLDEIARRAGVGAGTLYRHFPNRGALIEAVYRQEIADMSAHAYRFLEELPGDQALASWLREQVRFASKGRGLAVSLKATIDKESETFAWCHATLREAAEAILAAARAAGAAPGHLTPTDVLRIAHSVAVAAEPSDEGPDRLLSVVIDGLRAQAAAEYQGDRK